MSSSKINEWFGRYAAFLLKWRWAAIALFAAVMVASFTGMSRMVQQTSFDDYFIEGDPMLVKTNEFKAQFGNDYFVGILTTCDNHFTHDNTLRRESAFCVALMAQVSALKWNRRHLWLNLHHRGASGLFRNSPADVRTKIRHPSAVLMYVHQ